MEAAPEVATTNAKTTTNIPLPLSSSETDTQSIDDDSQNSDQQPTSAPAKTPNNVMVKSVTTAESESPAVGDAGGKVISSAAKAAAVAAVEALKSGNVKIDHSSLNATKLMSSSTNHIDSCLTNDIEDDDGMTEKTELPPSPVAKGAPSSPPIDKTSTPVSTKILNTDVGLDIDGKRSKEDDMIIGSLVSSNLTSSIVVPPLAPSSNDEGLDDSHSGDEDHPDLIKLKPPRPPRKKVKETLKEPLYEEDIIEGFSFAAFKTYEDLEVRI